MHCQSDHLRQYIPMIRTYCGGFVQWYLLMFDHSLRLKDGSTTMDHGTSVKSILFHGRWWLSGYQPSFITHHLTMKHHQLCFILKSTLFMGWTKNMFHGKTVRPLIMFIDFFKHKQHIFFTHTCFSWLKRTKTNNNHHVRNNKNTDLGY